jgi:MAPEG family
MLRKRIIALIQVAFVVLVCALAYAYGPAVAPRPGASDIAARLAFGVAWLIVPGVILLACIMVTALSRLFSVEAFDGTRTPPSRFMEINLRVTQNTLEQSMLAAIAWCGLALALPAERLGIIPVLAALFAVGRILFWMGYQINPLARAVGFGITALPTAVALLWLAWRAVA